MNNCTKCGSPPKEILCSNCQKPLGKYECGNPKALDDPYYCCGILESDGTPNPEALIVDDCSAACYLATRNKLMKLKDEYEHRH